MLSAQGHVKSLRKYLVNILLVIFAAKAKQSSSLVLRAHEFLKGLVWWIQSDALRPVFTADTPPERVITIENDDFAGRPLQCMELSGNNCGQCSKEKGRVRHLTQLLPV